MVTEIPDGIKKTLLDKLRIKKEKILEMDHGESTDLVDKRIVYRKPLNQDEKIKAFIVKGFEHAILIQLGRTIGILPEGVYEIDKKFQYAGTEIIWIDKTDFKTYWGVSDIILSDDFVVGAHGSLIARISDPKKFVMNLVSNVQEVERKQLDESILSFITSSYREILKEYTIDDLNQRRSEINEKVEIELFDSLNRWGIQAVSLEIEGFKLPEDFKEISVVKAKYEGEKRIGNLKAEYRKEEISREAEMHALETRLRQLKMEDQKDLTFGTIKRDIELKDLQRELKSKERSMLGDEKDFQRKQVLLDESTEFDKSQYEAASKKIKGQVDIDLLKQRSQSIGSMKMDEFKLKSEKEIELEKIKANRDIGVANADARTNEISVKSIKKSSSEPIKTKKKVEYEIQKIQQQLDKFDNMLESKIMKEDTYKLRVDPLIKRLQRLQEKMDQLI